MRSGVAIAILGLLAASCAGTPEATSPEPMPSSVAPSPTATSDPGLSCTGRGAPTVVLIPGLNTDHTTYDELIADLTSRHRVCGVDRAGLGDNPPLADSAPDPWPGSAADEVAESLTAEDGLFVVLGWSYGGLVAQSLTARHPDLVSGLVLEDSSSAEQLVDKAWDDIAWVEAGRTIDTRRAARALRTTDFGDRPTVVLTQDRLTGRLARLWNGYQNRLVGSSSDAVHVRAVGSGHAIHEDDLDLVTAAVDAVAEAVASGSPLAACAATFADLGGKCLG